MSIFIGEKEFPIGSRYKGSVFEKPDYKGFHKKF